MLKKYPIIKKIIIGLLSLTLIAVIFIVWFISLLPSNIKQPGIEQTSPQELRYLSNAIDTKRGKILAVVTSASSMGSSGKKTGYELTELARAYYVFTANGFEVDIASPQGGKPPAVKDPDDMGKYDYAFLNDKDAQTKVDNSIALVDVDPKHYSAVYFVGGKGAMFDFPNNPVIQSIVRDYYQSNKVVGAVCHGPAALVDVMLDDGKPLLANKAVTSFTNDEELLLIPDAEQIFPFLLQSKIEKNGAQFIKGHTYLEQIAWDGSLITGQNPWSVWKLAESMIEQLGYTPVPREITAEENTISILATYENHGYEQAKAQIQSLQAQKSDSVDRVLLAMHSVVAVMQVDIPKFYHVVSLLAVADND